MQSLSLTDGDTVIRWHVLPGAGTPVVCLPGLSFAAVPNFLPLMTRPEFRERRVLMIDYVGSGLSGHSKTFGYGIDDHARSIAAVLEADGHGPATLLGHSMGGTVAIALALLRPELVAKVVACEGNLMPGGGEASRRIAAIDPDRFSSTDHPERMAALSKAARDGDAFASFLWAARNGADPRGIWGNAQALVHLSPEFQARFLALQSERHFVYGEQGFPGRTGRVTPDLPDPELLASHGVGIHVVPGVGHPMMIEDPVETARVLAGVL